MRLLWDVSAFESSHTLPASLAIPLTYEHEEVIFHPVKKEHEKILVFGGETQNFISVNISSRSIMSLKSGNSSCHHRRWLSSLWKDQLIREVLLRDGVLILECSLPTKDIFPRPEHRLVFFPVANYCLGLWAIQRLDYSIPIGNCHRHFHPLDIFSSFEIDQIVIRK